MFLQAGLVVCPFWIDRTPWMKAYKRAGDTVTWVGAVAALQSQMHLPVHVGGKTALQLLGRSHFLSMQGIKQVSLFASPQTRIPSWLEKNELWDARVFGV